jgi:hypothetical protein
MKIKDLKFVINTGNEYWAFTKKPKIVLKNHSVNFNRRSGVEVNITALWKFYHQGGELYRGIIYETANVSKSFSMFPYILELAKSAYMEENEIV